MDIFRIEILFNEDEIIDRFLLKLPYCGEVREQDTYWYYEMTNNPDDATVYTLLIDFLEEWDDILTKPLMNKNVFFAIGFWDEYRDGFCISFLNNNRIKIEYGFTLDWNFSLVHILYDISEEILHREFAIETTIDNFRRDIKENIEYLNLFKNG